MDSFLFESATENPENAVIISRIINERVTGKKVGTLVVHPQKESKGINISKHGIRMDIYTEELEENNQIVYNNGVTKIFLYTKGTVGGSKELKELLTFMEDSIRDNAVDNELVEIMDIVDTVKSDSEERRRYMGIMNVIDYEKRDAYEEGIIHGVIQTCKSFGVSEEKTVAEIVKQFSISESDAKEYVTLYWDKELTNTPW